MQTDAGNKNPTQQFPGAQRCSKPWLCLRLPGDAQVRDVQRFRVQEFMLKGLESRCLDVLIGVGFAAFQSWDAFKLPEKFQSWVKGRVMQYR